MTDHQSRLRLGPEDDSPPPARTLAELALRFNEALLEPLMRSQDAASASYLAAAGRGADLYTFGVNSWSYATNLMYRQIRQGGAAGFVMERGAGCVILHGDWRIRHHRVGQHEGQDIHASFPKGAQQVIKEHLAAPSRERPRAQPSLFGFDALAHELSLGLPVAQLAPSQVVLAYMSHPERGLRAVYLATVGRVEDQQISEWAQAILLWKAQGITPEPVPEDDDDQALPLLDAIARASQR